MKKSFRLAMFLNLVILLFFLGCSPQKPNPATFSQTRTVIPLATVFELMPTRRAKFENALRLSIDQKSISFTRLTDVRNISGKLRFDMILQSNADFPISFRKPQVVNVNLPLGSESFPDLTVAITPLSHREMSFDSMSASWVNYEKVTEQDYIRIEPHQAYALPISLEVPDVYFRDTKYSGTIPEGEYEMQIGYLNVTLGYELPLLETPPADLSLQEEFAWQNQHQGVVDLDAWVGTLVSEKVTFTISK